MTRISPLKHLSVSLSVVAAPGRSLLLACFFAVASVASAEVQQDRVHGNLIMLCDNGGWCWYQDERTLYDAAGENVLFASVANLAGYEGKVRNADIDVTSFNLTTGKRTRVTLGKIATMGKGDDHNVAALWLRPDGRYFAMYTGHNFGSGINRTPQGSDKSLVQSFFRIARRPHDNSRWQGEQSFTWPSNDSTKPVNNDVTYTNLLYLAHEGTGMGRLYNIARAADRTPNIAYSDDWGASWLYGGKLSLTGSADQQGQYSNGYFKFSTNGADRIDFVATEHHPRNFNNSIYHGTIKGGKSFNSKGMVVDENLFDEVAPAPSQFTRLWKTSAVTDTSYHHGWTSELERDAEGNLYALFTTRYGTSVVNGHPGAGDHRIFYARFSAATGDWTTTELGKVGPALFNSEEDYTGIGAIHPNDPNTVFISTPFDPRSSEPLAHHEIFKGVTRDDGGSWDWTPITENSTADNLRPIVPAWDADNTALLWLRGTYRHQTDYDQTVVGIIDRADEKLGLVDYVDANRSNTTAADGTALDKLTTERRASDNLWHLRTDIGNDDSVLAANEEGQEDVPTLRTTLTGLDDGVYEVFTYFWANPEEDWRILAGFDQRDLLVFRRVASQRAVAGQFDEEITLSGRSVSLYQAYVGRVTVVAGSAVSVFIDGVGSSAAERTWYDGLGVARVSQTGGH